MGEDTSRVLEEASSVLNEKYPDLVISQNFSPEDASPFLHVWKPVCKPSPSQGLKYLPCFHVIVTSCYDEALDEHGIQVQLLTFHGKLLICSNIELSQLETVSELTDLSNDNLHICQGLLESEVRSKERTDSLTEFLADQVVVRSRKCRFAVQKKTESEGQRCSECVKLKESSIKFEPECLLKTEQNGMQESVNSKHGGERIVFSNKDQLLASIGLPKKVKTEEQLSGDSSDVLPCLDFNDSITVEKTNDLPSKFSGVESGRKRGRGRPPGRRNTVKTLIIDSDCQPSDGVSDNSEDEDFKPPYHASEKRLKVRKSEQTKRNRVRKIELPSPSQIDDLKCKVCLVVHNSPSKAQKCALKHQQVKCKICMIVYTSEDQMNQCMDKHRQFMNFDAPGTCPECKYPFESKLEVTDHFQVHHRPYTCCPECFRMMKVKKLNMHILCEHHKDFSLVKPAKKYTYFQKPLVDCKVCLLKYRSQSSLKNCMDRHAEEMDLMPSVICPLCHEFIISKVDLTDHFKEKHSEENKTCCCECLLVVSNEDGVLRKHITKCHHAAGKSLLCSECGKEYRSKLSLDGHIKEVHEKSNAFMCEHCGDSFAHRTKYRRHLKTHDPNDLKCMHCDKSFVKRLQLLRHLALHTKYKPFKCRHCAYTSARKGNISLHVEKVHHQKWTNDDIVVDEFLLAEMRKTTRGEAAEVMKVRQT